MSLCRPTTGRTPASLASIRPRARHNRGSGKPRDWTMRSRAPRRPRRALRQARAAACTRERCRSRPAPHSPGARKLERQRLLRRGGDVAWRKLVSRTIACAHRRRDDPAGLIDAVAAQRAPGREIERGARHTPAVRSSARLRGHCPPVRPDRACRRRAWFRSQSRCRTLSRACHAGRQAARWRRARGRRRRVSTPGTAAPPLTACGGVLKSETLTSAVRSQLSLPRFNWPPASAICVATIRAAAHIAAARAGGRVPPAPSRRRRSQAPPPGGERTSCSTA